MEVELLVTVFVGQAGLGVVGTLAVYKILEWNLGLGWLFGLVLVGAVVGAEWVLGEALLTVTVEEMQVLVVLAIVGSLIGVFSTVVLTKPDIETSASSKRGEAHAGQLER